MNDNIEQNSASTNSEYYEENPTIPAPEPSNTSTSSETATPVSTPTETPTSSTIVTSSNSTTTAASGATTAVTGGDVVIIQGKELRVSGYVDVGNGELIPTYTDYNPDNSYGQSMNSSLYNTAKEYYVDSNNNLQPLERNQANSNYRSASDTVTIGGKEYNWESTWQPLTNTSQTFEVSGTQAAAATGKYDYTIAVKNSDFNGKQITVGTTVTINGEDYYTVGYVDMGNGKKKPIYQPVSEADEYWGSNKYYYFDKNGKLQESHHWNDTTKTTIDGKDYTVVKGMQGDIIELSDEDQAIFKNEDEPTPEETPEVSGVNSSNDSNYRNINEEYPLQVNLINRKRYYVIYKYESTTDTFVNNSYGPLNAKEGRQVAYETFNMVPGQGFGAKELAISFEKLIGNIKYALEDVIELSKQAVIFPNRTPKNPGGAKAQNILDYVETITPTIYKNFAKVMPAVVELANTTQKSKNTARYNDALSEKNRLKSIYSYNTDSTMSIKTEEIIEDVVTKYKGYLTGYEYTQSSPSITSSLPRESAKLEEYGDLNISFLNTKVIIDDLELIIRNFIIEAEKIIEAQTNKIKAVNGFTPSLATRLSFTNIDEPLIELREKVKELLYMYRGWLEEAEKIKNGGDSATSNPTPSPTPGPSSWPSNGGGGTTGPTSPPTTSPTTPKTEAPIDNRTTEPPVVQPRIDDATNNGGTNGGSSNGGSNGGGTPVNGNSHGGDYSPYGGYSGGTSNESSSTEVPSEVPDVIKEGNSYTLPTSTKPVQPTTPTTSKGNSAIPVLAGLAAAAAAGIGAKAYIDRKKNRNNDEESEEFKAEDWSGNNEINIEYQEPKTNEAETLDDDYEFEEPEKYGARSNQELENLQ